MRIRHPYHFVPFTETLEREPLSETPGHGCYHPDLFTGSLRCKLEAKSMLTIKTHFQSLQEAKQAPYVPGSSLKGMVRNLAQVIGAGCGLLFPDQTQDPKYRKALKRGDESAKRRQPLEPHLGHLQPCSPEAACLVCRVFGYAPARGESDEVAEERLSGWAGKVRFHDSQPAESWRYDAWCRPAEGAAQWQAQGPYHTAFYFPDARNPHRPAGWKVYLHAKRVTAPHPDFRPEACVSPNTVFPFQVDCENLTPEEFAVLRFALTLEHDCAEYRVGGLSHKLGYGKPIGLGSCKISIEVVPLSLRRYFGEGAHEVKDPGCVIHKYLQSPGFKALEEFLSWDNRPEEIRYPSYRWFLENPTASIEQYERDVNQEEADLAPVNPVLAHKPKSAQSQPPPEVSIPKKLKVTITSISGGKTRFETVETYGGHKYTGNAINTLYQAKSGDTCQLKVNSLDHGNKRLTGRISWG